MSPLPRWEITRKAETSRGVYWGVGPTVTVLDAPGYPTPTRFVCLTDRANSCDHITALRRHLRVDASDEVAA